MEVFIHAWFPFRTNVRAQSGIVLALALWLEYLHETCRNARVVLSHEQHSLLDGDNDRLFPHASQRRYIVCCDNQKLEYQLVPTVIPFS